MTTQQKLVLLEMANSKHIHDHVLCLELLQNNLHYFTPTQVNCIALLCSQIKHLAGGVSTQYLPIISVWAKSIDMKGVAHLSGSGYAPYYEYCKKLLQEELVRENYSIIKEEIKMKQIEVR